MILKLAAGIHTTHRPLMLVDYSIKKQINIATLKLAVMQKCIAIRILNSYFTLLCTRELILDNMQNI